MLSILNEFEGLIEEQNLDYFVEKSQQLIYNVEILLRQLQQVSIDRRVLNHFQERHEVIDTIQKYYHSLDSFFRQWRSDLIAVKYNKSDAKNEVAHEPLQNNKP